MDWQKKYQEWLSHKELSDYLRLELAQLTDEKEREDRFYRYLEFGTGGMRGELGAGTNRMNEYSIKRVAAALAQCICDQGDEAKKKGVVIAYDNRLFSPYFAEWTARVLASFDIQVYLSDTMRPTPELSFLVRHYHAEMGVMITASHNPAQYNGFKVYGLDGGQITLETADKLSQFLELIDNELELTAKSLSEYLSEGLVSYYGKEADEVYLENLKKVSQRPEIIEGTTADCQVVYTPLHGTGANLITRGLAQIGINQLAVVDQQSDGDAVFYTVESPNPEEHKAFELALDLAREKKAKLVMATDPDADRLGIAVYDDSLEDYRLLNGNQIGVLLLNYLLECKKNDGIELEEYFLAKTIVTSELGSVLAGDYGVKTRNTLTGFKFIGEQIEESEKDQSGKFLFGYEESYGYLIEPFVRDKDAIQAAVLMAEMCVYYSNQSENLLDVLDRIYIKYGYYQESLSTLTFKGKSGQQEMNDRIECLRKMKLLEVANEKIQWKEDYFLQERTNLITNKMEVLKLPKSNVLKYILEDDSWFCIRPSGTEPKCKLYFSVHERTDEKAVERLQKLEKSINEIFVE